jgi:copper chaperone CopZ
MAKASAYFTVKNMDDKHDVKKLKRELDTLDGILSVTISEGKDSIAVDFDTTGARQERIRSKIEKLGYDVLNVRVDRPMM